MAGNPVLGMRTSLTPETIANRQEVTYSFDEATGQFVSLDRKYTAEELEKLALAFYLDEEAEVMPAGVNDWVVQV